MDTRPANARRAAVMPRVAHAPLSCYNRTMMTPRWTAPLRLALLATALLAGAVSVGCRRPDYVKFSSDFGDVECEVPWGWTVLLDKQGKDFYNYTFIGPFDASFFR